MVANVLFSKYRMQPQQGMALNGVNSRALSFVALPSNGKFVDALYATNTTTITGAPTASAGLGGIAVEFNGSSKIQYILNSAYSFTTGFTVTCSFVPKDSGTKGSIVSLRGASATFQIARNSSNGIQIDKQQAANIFTTGSLGMTTGTLHTIAISFINNTRYSMAVNGRLVTSGVYNWGADTGNTFYIGGRDSDASEAFTGSILGVYVHSFAADDSQLIDMSNNPWPRVSNRKLWVNVPGGTQSYTYTASGGMILSGTGPIVKGAIKTPTGGLTLLGTANPARGVSRTSTGGLTFSGTATPLRSLVRAASGGILFSGAASVSFFSAVQSLVVVASGGILIRGTSTMIRGVVKAVTGGIIFGGSASITLTPDPSPTTKHNFKRGRRPRIRPNY